MGKISHTLKIFNRSFGKVKVLKHRVKVLFWAFAFSVLAFSCQENPGGTKSVKQDETEGVLKEEKNKEPLNMTSLEFEYKGETRSIEIGMAPGSLRELESAAHVFSYQGPKPPANWKEQYYRMFLSHSADEEATSDILNELRKLKPGAPNDELAEMATAFVQGAITYDWQTFHNLDQSSIRYPSQTLQSGTGVCADKTMLLARLLGKLGFEMVSFTFKRANHIALGIKVPKGYGSYGTDYAFVESTTYAPIGRIPDTYAGGIKLDRRAEIVPLTTGGTLTFHKIIENQAREKELEQLYGKEYLFLSADLQALKREMTELGNRIEVLKKESKGCRGTLAPSEYERCQKLTAEINEKVDRFNAIVADFNRKVAARNGQV